MIPRRRLRRARGRLRAPAVALALAFGGCAAPPGDEGAADLIEPEPPVWRSEIPGTIVDEPWTGELEGMRQRRLVRVLTTYNRTGYFLDGAEERGAVHETMRAFEDYLNRGRRRGELRTYVVLIPVQRHQLLPSLLAGAGDLVAANLTITDARREKVAFSIPVLEDVREVVVAGTDAPVLDGIPDLCGRAVHVRPNSSYAESLAQLQPACAQAGRPPVQVQEAAGWLETEDLLEMVSAGHIPYTIADDHLAGFWGEVLDGLRVRSDLVVRSGGSIAWAFRRGSPALEEAVNGFLRGHRQGTLFGNVMLQRYLRDTSRMRNPGESAAMERFRSLAPHLRRAAARHGLDWLLLAAQAYQESGLDQSRRSAAGAVGVMQLLPRTAAAPPIGIPDIHQADRNVEAGARYLRHILDEHLADPELAETDRMWLALAAYNAGPSRVRKLRRRAAEMGLDPDRWFHHVEVAAARHVGQETVRYVSNIARYYLVYRRLAGRLEAGAPPV